MGKRKGFGRAKPGKSGDQVSSELEAKEYLQLYWPIGICVMRKLCLKGRAETGTREKHHLWPAFHQLNSKVL